MNRADPEVENPFGEGESRVLKPGPTVIVIFGATGDLTQRKLLPGLYNLFLDNMLPQQFAVVGVARSKLSDDRFRENSRESIAEFSRRPVDEKNWQGFAKQLFYQAVDGTELEQFVGLKDRLTELRKGIGSDYKTLYYLSVTPERFASIAENLKKSGLVEVDSPDSRVVIEKPFGRDLASAKKLNSELRDTFSERQIFRIDHYLGKETVQNILVMRFANGILEPLWNHRYVDRIEISVCESIGVGSRADYFDSNGIVRDIVQNHLLQMLSLLCIEPPLSLSDADSIRNEKVKVLRSIKQIRIEDVAKSTVRAQYQRGFIDGDEVGGYLEEPKVKQHSATETYFAMHLEIDNWRWAGVPIYIRVGKRLPKRITQIAVFFKRAPSSLFKGRQVSDLDQNALIIQVQPNEEISFRINSKPPGPRLRAQPVTLDFTYGSSFGRASAEAYERLILDAMRGDATLFIRDDEIEAAWDLLSPVLASWESDSAPPLYTYEAGTWGPAAAATLLRAAGHRWTRL